MERRYNNNIITAVILETGVDNVLYVQRGEAMKKLLCMLFTALFLFIPFVLVFAGDRENSIEVGQTRDQMRQMEEQLESIREESDKRAAAANEYSTQASESMDDGTPEDWD